MELLARMEEVLQEQLLLMIVDVAVQLESLETIARRSCLA